MQPKTWKTNSQPFLSRRACRRFSVRSDPSAPYIVVEASVHKLLLGHNIDGGPVAFRPSCRWFVHLVGELLQVHLDPADRWLVARADWAEVYSLQRNLVRNLIAGLHHARYPRRKRVAYGSDGLAFAGQVNTLNIYQKGPEISLDDRRRLSVCYQPAEVNALLNLAMDSLRVEVQVKTPQLKNDFGDKPHVDQIDGGYLQSVFDQTIDRLDFDPHGAAAAARTKIDVDAALISKYGTKKANSLIGAWHRLAGLGEDLIREQVSRATLHRWKRDLLKAGCSWLRKMFRLHTGLPLAQYQMQLRLNHARELLSNTTLPVATVGCRNGFESAYYFSRVFRSKVGCSPSEYRLQARKLALTGLSGSKTALAAGADLPDRADIPQ